MATKLEWRPWWIAEQVTEEFDLPYEIKPFKTAAIDWKETKNNCGRLGAPVVQNVVEDYTRVMKAGAKFPMPIVVLTPDGIVVVAGIHRCLAAIEAGAKEIPAYHVKIDLPIVFRRVAARSNEMESPIGLDEDERMEYVLHEVIKGGMDLRESCKTHNVNFAKMSTKLNLHNLRQTGIEGGSRYGSRVLDKHVRCLGKLRTNPKILAAAMDSVHELDLNEENTKDLVATMLRGKSEIEQLQAMQGFCRQFTKKGPGPRLPLRNSFHHKVNALFNLVHGKKELEDVQIKATSDEAAETWHERVDPLIKTLLKMFSKTRVAVGKRSVGKNRRAS